MLPPPIKPSKHTPIGLTPEEGSEYIHSCWKRHGGPDEDWNPDYDRAALLKDLRDCGWRMVIEGGANALGIARHWATVGEHWEHYFLGEAIEEAFAGIIEWEK